MTSPRRPRFSPELRAGLFHATVFGGSGVTSVYFAIWLADRGVGPDEIGIINAVPILILLLINQVIGRIADRASDWRQVIVILALLAGALPVALFFVSGFWSILLIWTLCAIPASSMIPVLDAATLRMTQRNGSDFGMIRAWGTIGYMATAAAAGPVLGWLGDAAFVPLFLGMSLLRAALALQLPRFRAPADQSATVAKAPRGALRQVMRPWFLLPLVGFGLHYGVHMLLAAFAALLWREQGIDPGLIGPLIAVAAGAEALIMFLWTRLGWKLSARHMLIVSMAVGAFRWAAMAFSPPLLLLVALQLLHAFTFALGYFGAIHFVANWTTEEVAAEAQGFSYVLQQAFSVLALVVFGWIVATWGPLAWLFAAAFSALGVVLTLISLRLQPAHKVGSVDAAKRT